MRALAVALVLVAPGVAVADSGTPHFPIAEAYGARAWSSLCESRGRPMVRGGDIDELASYVHAWCAPTSDDRLEALNTLTHARTPGLAAAVRADIVALLANSRPADRSVEWLEDHHETTGDDLAVAYARAWQGDEAFAAALATPSPSTPASLCAHLEHLVSLSPEPTDASGSAQRQLDVLRARGTCRHIAYDLEKPERARLAYRSPPQPQAAMSPEKRHALELAVALTADPGQLADAANRAGALDAFDRLAGACPYPVTRADLERFLAHPSDPHRPYADLENALIVAKGLATDGCRP